MMERRKMRNSEKYNTRDENETTSFEVINDSLKLSKTAYFGTITSRSLGPNPLYSLRVLHFRLEYVSTPVTLFTPLALAQRPRSWYLSSIADTTTKQQK